jgi:surface antigen
LALGALSLTLPVAPPAAAEVGKPLASIFSCQAPGGKQVAGAAIGGVVGGVVGSKVSDGALGTLLGAAVGAAAGSYLGCRMQKSAQRKAEAATRAALEQNRNGSWSDPATGASGDVRIVNYGAPVNMAGLRFAAGVEPADGYESAPGRYRARGVANIRGAPSASAPIVGKLKAGESFDSLARVARSNWLLAGRDGVGVGYVSESVVSPAAGSIASACKTFDQTLNTNGGAPETRRYTACRNSAGEWVVQG